MVILLVLPFVPSCDQLDLKEIHIFGFAKTLHWWLSAIKISVTLCCLIHGCGLQVFKNIYFPLLRRRARVCAGLGGLFSFSFAFVNWTRQQQHCSWQLRYFFVCFRLVSVAGFNILKDLKGCGLLLGRLPNFQLMSSYLSLLEVF